MLDIGCKMWYKHICINSYDKLAQARFRLNGSDIKNKTTIANLFSTFRSIMPRYLQQNSYDDITAHVDDKHFPSSVYCEMIRFV